MSEQNLIKIPSQKIKKGHTFSVTIPKSLIMTQIVDPDKEYEIFMREKKR